MAPPKVTSSLVSGSSTPSGPKVMSLVSPAVATLASPLLALMVSSLIVPLAAVQSSVGKRSSTTLALNLPLMSIGGGAGWN